MSFPVLIALVALGSVPAGYAAALAARKFSGDKNPSPLPMIAACAMLGGQAALAMPAGCLLAATYALGWALLVLSAVDALVFRLPDILTLPLILAGLALSALLPQPDLVGHAIAALLGLSTFYAVMVAYRSARGRDGLGLGDVKLAGAAGAWLGWQALPSVILVACAAGLIWFGIAAIRRGKTALSERIPFGVALSLAIWLTWLYGPLTLFSA